MAAAAFLLAACSSADGAGTAGYGAGEDWDHAGFEAIVLGGALVPHGMPQWDDLLSAEQVRAIHAYLIDEQARLPARELELQRQGEPLDSPSAAILSNF